MTTHEDNISALNSVLNGLRLAQSRGAFSLEESAILYHNIQTLVKSLNPNVDQDQNTNLSLKGDGKKQILSRPEE